MARPCAAAWAALQQETQIFHVCWSSISNFTFTLHHICSHSASLIVFYHIYIILILYAQLTWLQWCVLTYTAASELKP